MQFVYPSIQEISPDDNNYGNIYVDGNNDRVGI